jgi:hypothetical protein
MWHDDGIVLCPVNTYCPLSRDGSISCGVNAVSQAGSISRDNCTCIDGMHPWIDTINATNRDGIICQNDDEASSLSRPTTSPTIDKGS